MLDNNYTFAFSMCILWHYKTPYDYKAEKILRMCALLDPIIEEEKMEVLQWFAFEAEISS